MKTVASLPIVDPERWQQYLIDDTAEGDHLLAALKEGPIKPEPLGGASVIDLDQVNQRDDSAVGWIIHGG